MRFAEFSYRYIPDVLRWITELLPVSVVLEGRGAVVYFAEFSYKYMTVFLSCICTCFGSKDMNMHTWFMFLRLDYYEKNQ